MKKLLFLACMVTTVFVTTNFTITTPAHARIECNGRYQVIRDHGELSTPYCEQKLLTYVAYEYGYNYSFRQVRKSFAIKQKICDHIGHDLRVDDICSSFRSNDHGNRSFR